MTEMPQRILAYELRVAIDRCRRSSDRRHLERLLTLIDENQRGVWSSHVQHNLGKARREWWQEHVVPELRVREGIFV